jgi:hypothetical protein
MVMQSSYVSGKFYMFLPLELTLRPSRVYLAVQLAAHGLALLGAWLAVLPFWIQAALTLGLMINFIWVVREISSSPRGMRVSQSGQIELLEQEWQPVQIKGRPVVLPWLISLTLVTASGNFFRVILWPDSADSDRLRKLRVWLRWNLQSGRETLQV